MSETYGSELEARQALAKTTYDLWVDGKLKDGAEATSCNNKSKRQ